MRLSTAAIIPALLGAAYAGETESTSDSISKIAGNYGWDPFVISKIGDGIAALTAADVDGDGRGDLAVIHNGRARIEILRLPKPGEAAGDGKPRDGATKTNELNDESFFKRESVPVEEKVSAIAFADLDGDKVPELLWLGDSGKLTVARRAASGDYSPAQRLDAKKASGSSSALKVGDLDADGQLDVVVFGVDDTSIYRLQPDKRLGEATKLPNASRGADVFGLLDVDGDSRLDLVYVTLGSDWPLRVRLGKGGATFGPEVASRFAELRSCAFGDFDKRPGAEVIGVRAKSGRLALLRFKPQVEGEQGPLSALRSVPLTAIKDQDQREFVAADLDGDGRVELLVAEPSAAQVVLHRDLIGGDKAPETAASFTGVGKPRLADVDGDKVLDLIVASAAEKVIGISRIDPKSGIGFPSALPIPEGGEILAIDAADMDGDGKAEIVMLAADGKGKDRKGRLALLNEKGEQKASFLVDKLLKDPNDLWMIDLNRDGKRDALLFVPRDLPRMFLAAADGQGFTEVKIEERGIGLLNGLERTQLAYGDLDGDGRHELIIPKGNFVRAIFLDVDQKPATVAQLNLDDAAAQVERVSLLDLDGDGRNELLVQDKTAGTIEVWSSDAESNRRKAKLELSGLVPAFLLGADLDADGRSDVVAAAVDRVAVVRNGATDPGFERVADLDVPLKKALPDRVAVGDVNGDGESDVAVTESVDHQLLFAAVHPDSLEYALRFTVFETRIFQVERGGREPRDVVIADCTGDGRHDVAIVVHDRVIVYPQQ